jgi:hypothetical protein
MNTNGILLYTRAYNTASTAAQPSVIAVQIGKGLKGVQYEAYGSTTKTLPFELHDSKFTNSILSQEIGVHKTYNAITGILEVDAGYRLNSGNNSAQIGLDAANNTSRSTGYLVINASKNPSILGLGLETVAARGVSTSGQSIPNTGINTMLYDAVKTYDTTGSLNSATGIFTTPESGYYQASWSCLFGMTSNLGQVITTFLYKNGAAHSAGAYNTMDRAVLIDAGSTGSCGVYLTKGDTVQVVIVNNRAAGATALTATLAYNHFSIHKTSLSTGK